MIRCPPASLSLGWLLLGPILHPLSESKARGEVMCGCCAGQRQGRSQQEISEQGNTEITPAQLLFKGNHGTAEALLTVQSNYTLMKEKRQPHKESLSKNHMAKCSQLPEWWEWYCVSLLSHIPKLGMICLTAINNWYTKWLSNINNIVWLPRLTAFTVLEWVYFYFILFLPHCMSLQDLDSLSRDWTHVLNSENPES